MKSNLREKGKTAIYRPLLHNTLSRVRPRVFDQVGHQTTNASIGNKYFFTK